MQIELKNARSMSDAATSENAALYEDAKRNPFRQIWAAVTQRRKEPGGQPGEPTGRLALETPRLEPQALRPQPRSPSLHMPQRRQPLQPPSWSPSPPRAPQAAIPTDFDKYLPTDPLQYWEQAVLIDMYREHATAEVLATTNPLYLRQLRGDVIAYSFQTGRPLPPYFAAAWERMMQAQSGSPGRLR